MFVLEGANATKRRAGRPHHGLCFLEFRSPDNLGICRHLSVQIGLQILISYLIFVVICVMLIAHAADSHSFIYQQCIESLHLHVHCEKVVCPPKLEANFGGQTCDCMRLNAITGKL